MDLLQKAESRMGTQLSSLWLQRPVRIYCPGLVGGKEGTDRLENTADITSGLQLGRAEVLRGLRNFSKHRQARASQHWLKERGAENGGGQHSTFHDQKQSVFIQTERGVEKGSGQHSTFQDQRQSLFNQMVDKHWHCFKANAGKTTELGWSTYLPLPAEDAILRRQRDRQSE